MEIIGSLLNLERTIPDSVLAGVLSNQYSVHGGVIRNASGQIVRHLIPAAGQSLNPFGLVGLPFDFINTYQLHRLSEMSQQLMIIGTTTMALSGLNLAVSSVGFLALNKSLKEVEDQLKKMDAKLDWIRTFLDSGRRATLMHAAEELSILPSDAEHRKQILYKCRDALGQVAMHYLQHWDESSENMEAMSYQHYYAMALLMKVRCSAELEMHQNAVTELERGLRNWRDRSRALALDGILHDEESRFLLAEYVDLVPSAKIAGWLDFAHDKALGYEWIDTLRRDIDSGSIRLPWSWNEKEKKKTEIQQISFMDNLVSRNQVLEGYKTQYDFFAANQIRPSQLDYEVSKVSKEHVTEGFLVLAPAENP